MTKTDHPLRRWRKEHKKTLADLAGTVRVTSSHLSEIENWKNEPSLDLASRLQRETGIEMSAFVKPGEVTQ